MSVQVEKADRNILASFRAKKTSLSRVVIWIEVGLVALVVVSRIMTGWAQSKVDLFNMIFVAFLIGSFIIGLGLFLVSQIKFEQKVIKAISLIMAGCLMVSYSALMYETGIDTMAWFLALVIPGTIMAILGIGVLMVGVRQSSRVAGYYSLWLFGMLLMLFMPLHELGTLNYGSRDYLIGYFGFIISLVGALSFVIEKQLAERMDDWVTIGDAKYIAGKFDEAVEYYEEALHIEPKNAKLWANNGYTFLKLGMWTKALENFNKALRLDAGLATAHDGKALALSNLKRFSEALESHDQGLKVENSSVGWNNRGNTLVRMGAPGMKAIESYAKALDVDPNYEIAWLNKGKAELKNNDISAALESLTHAVELKPLFAEAWLQKGKALSMFSDKEQEALYCLDIAIELNPTNADAWMERKTLLASMKEGGVKPVPLVHVSGGAALFGPAARNRPLLEDSNTPIQPSGTREVTESDRPREEALAMATRGDYTGAIEVLDATLARFPDDAAALMTKGILLSRIEKFDQALESFEVATRLKPDWVGPLFSKGMALTAMGDCDTAHVVMDRVTQMCPTYTDAWGMKGIILDQQQRYVEALACFDKEIEINPQNADAWRSKFNMLNKLGRYDEAITCLERLIPLAENIEQTRRFMREEKGILKDARKLFSEGVELAKARLYDEALDLLKQATEMHPNFVDALYISGVICSIKGANKEAMQHFERVLELRPNHVEALYGKANMLLKQGNHAAALELLDRALEKNRDHVDAWSDRGVALAKLGKHAEALECYDKALKLAGNHPQAIAQRERCVKMMMEANEGKDKSSVLKLSIC